jgi:hypothetical protein
MAENELTFERECSFQHPSYNENWRGKLKSITVYCTLTSDYGSGEKCRIDYCPLFRIITLLGDR